MSEIRERTFVPVLLYVGMVVSIVSSLGAPLIPDLAQKLHTSLGNAQWALTATVLVAAVASPVIGRLGDGPHRKRVVVTSLGAVVLGCVMAALAQTLPVLIAGRSLQGLGLALMPLTMAAAREHLAPDRAVRAIAAISVIAVIGVGLGYPVTGLIADHMDVSAAYWFGAVTCLLALVAAAIVIPDPESESESRHLDVTGAVIAGVGLTTLLLALEKGPDWGWGSPRVPGMLLAGLLLLALWARHELRTAEPLVELRLVRHPAVLTANVTAFLLGVTMYLLMVMVTQFVQLPGIGLGESVFVAGLSLVPLSLFSALSSRAMPWVEDRIGTRPIIPLGSLAVATSAVLFATSVQHLWQLLLVTGLLGVGFGFTFAAMPGLIVGAVPRRETGSAMGFYQVSRFVGFSVGSGVAVTLLRAFGEAGQPTLGAYHGTALVAAGLGIATAVIGWLLPGRSLPVDHELDEVAIEEGSLAASGLERLERDLPKPGREAVGAR